MSCCERPEKASVRTCILCGRMVCGRCQKLVNNKPGCPVCANCFSPSMAGPSPEDAPAEPARPKQGCEIHDSISSAPCAFCADVICKNCRTVIEGRHTCARCRERRLAELRAD